MCTIERRNSQDLPLIFQSLVLPDCVSTVWWLDDMLTRDNRLITKDSSPSYLIFHSTAQHNDQIMLAKGRRCDTTDRHDYLNRSWEVVNEDNQAGKLYPMSDCMETGKKVSTDGRCVYSILCEVFFLCVLVC